MRSLDPLPLDRLVAELRRRLDAAVDAETLTVADALPEGVAVSHDAVIAELVRRQKRRPGWPPDS